MKAQRTPTGLRAATSIEVRVTFTAPKPQADDFWLDLIRLSLADVKAAKP